MNKYRPNELVVFTKEHKNTIEEIERDRYSVLLIFQEQNSNGDWSKEIYWSTSRRSILQYEDLLLIRHSFQTTNHNKNLIRVVNILPSNRITPFLRQFPMSSLSKALGHFVAGEYHGRFFIWRSLFEDMKKRYESDEITTSRHVPFPQVASYAAFHQPQPDGYPDSPYTQDFDISNEMVGVAGVYMFFRMPEKKSGRVFWFRLDTFRRSCSYWEEGELPDFCMDPPMVFRTNNTAPYPSLTKAFEHMLRKEGEDFLRRFLDQEERRPQRNFQVVKNSDGLDTIRFDELFWWEEEIED